MYATDLCHILIQEPKGTLDNYNYERKKNNYFAHRGLIFRLTDNEKQCVR